MLLSRHKQQRCLLEVVCLLAVLKDAMFLVLLAACFFPLSLSQSQGDKPEPGQSGERRKGSEGSGEGLFAPQLTFNNLRQHMKLTNMIPIAGM